MDISGWTKSSFLTYLRQKADSYKVSVASLKVDYKEKAKAMNAFVLQEKEKLLSSIPKTISPKEKLEIVLLITYCSNLVMLEYRNIFWNYDYMAFSRRIGEIWEPFCKLPFSYPLEKLKLSEPLVFSSVQNELQRQIRAYVSSLGLEAEKEQKLLQYYEMVWNLIDSGSINLSLDLHFEKDGIKYNVDYKSGFSSNEKGNTNRLLLVGSIYSSISPAFKNLIFVRQEESLNNHYLQTLKNSPYWEVYCAEEAYRKIFEFTGFNIKEWMERHMDWKNDISQTFKQYLTQNDLIKYLTW